MLLVELVRGHLHVRVLAIVEDLARLLVQEKSKFLAWVPHGVREWDLREDLSHDDRDSVAILVFLLRLVVKPHRIFQTGIRHDVTLHDDEVVLKSDFGVIDLTEG